MTGGWVDHGRVLGSADVPARLIELARTELLLLEPGDPEAGRLVAFSSAAAMAAAGLAGQPCRAVHPLALAADWPGPEWGLVLDPGSASQVLLDAQGVQDVAELAAQPAGLLEARLYRALERGDIEAYVTALLDRSVILAAEEVTLEAPVDSLGIETAVAFSSWRRWRELAGDAPGNEVPFARLALGWAGGTAASRSALVIDPATAHGARLAPELMVEVGEYLQGRLGRLG